MKIFNHRKWEAIQRRKDENYQLLRNISGGRDDASERFAKASDYFLNAYRQSIGGRSAGDMIGQDLKNLSVAEIEVKLKRLVNEWPAACEEFGLNEDFTGKDALIKLYGLMREKKRLQADHEKAAEACQSFGACYNALNEFAAKHGKSDHTTFNVVPDTGETYSAGSELSDPVYV